MKDLDVKVGDFVTVKLNDKTYFMEIALIYDIDDINAVICLYKKGSLCYTTIPIRNITNTISRTRLKGMINVNKFKQAEKNIEMRNVLNIL
jgi:hypothetical protein